MVMWRNLLAEGGRAHHLVQLYGSDRRTLTVNVARYLGEGLRREDGLLAIAGPPQILSFARVLRDMPEYQAGVRSGRLVFLDAHVALAGFMVGGQPDRERFDRTVGDTVRGMRARSPSTGMRAFGEMVGILWAGGQRAAAVRLEQYWNELLAANRFSLFCGYPIDVLGPEFAAEGMEPLFCAHTHLLPGDAELGVALERAMDEVLGSRAGEVRARIEASVPPQWAAMPAPETALLWLRGNLPLEAEQIVGRARRYRHPV